MWMLPNILASIATGVMWLIQKFFPFLIKKFGLGAIKFGIQKTASVAVVLVTLSFYSAVIIFISETYSVFNDVLNTINSPTSGMSGSSSEKFSCFLFLLDVSGIKSGFNSAFSFFVTVMLFFFTRGLYSLTVKSLKIVSDEINKATRLI